MIEALTGTDYLYSPSSLPLDRHRLRAMREILVRQHVDPEHRIVGSYRIVEELELLEEDSFVPLHDGSSPEEIKQKLGMSKKAFKKAIGGLYKARLIKLEKDGISLIRK